MEVIMLKKLLFLALTFLGINSASAYYHRAQAWENAGITYVLLGETHDSVYEANKVGLTQMQDVISWAKKLNAHIVVEDGLTLDSSKYIKDPFSAANKEYANSLTLFFNLDKATALRGLFSACHLAGIPVTNFECRLGLVNAQGQRTCDIIRHLTDMANKIKSFNDGESVNAIYHEEIKEFENLKKQMPVIFEYMRDETKSYQGTIEFFNNAINSEHSEIKNIFQQELQALANYYRRGREVPALTVNLKIATDSYVAFESRLVDSFLLHTVCNQKAPVVFVCAGDGHIKWLADAFQKLGFDKKGSMGDIPYQFIEKHNITSSYKEHDAININQFFEGYFSSSKNHNTGWNAVNTLLAIRNKINVNAKQAGLIQGTILPLIPSIAAIASLFATPRQYVTIAGKQIPLPFITAAGTYLATALATYKYLYLPQPVKKSGGLNV